MLENTLILLSIFSFIFFLYKRFKVLMLFFQQEEYEGNRFLKYTFTKCKLIDKKLSLVLLVTSALCYFIQNNTICLSLLLGVLLTFIFIEVNPSKNAKKTLALTMRVKRIFFISFVNVSILSLLLLKVENISMVILGVVLMVQSLPFILILSNVILTPFEKRIKNRYLQDAKEKIKKINPIVIGITGSYGKTSTKHILYHILSSVFPTLTTPGSVNTPMGVTRIIREKLEEKHKYFIVEMGAYGPGSIKRLCELTPPNYGIITSVGSAHYERFKTIENVAKTKFELSDSVKQQKGTTFVNIDSIKEDFVLKYSDKTVKVGKSSKANYLISDVKETKEGLHLKVKYKNKEFILKTPLYGLHHAENIVLSFALAQEIGVDANTVIASLHSVPQIKHRLEVLTNKFGPTVIDDAYNSNPVGFLSALKVLNLLKKNGGRRILVTPGMVELGELHNEKHKEIGKKATEYTDIVLLISPERIPSFVSAFEKDKTSEQKLYTFPSFAEAKKWIETNAIKEDVILYENDLPDLYENNLKL